MTIEATSETTAGDAGNYTITRSFTATDDAGKAALLPNHHDPDTTAPEFTFIPAETTVECPDEMPRTTPPASDNR